MLINSNFRCIQNAWLKILYDFRAWMIPDTELLEKWKTRPILPVDKTQENPIVGLPIVACRSRMMDDVETMLKAYRETKALVQNETDKKKGEEDADYAKLLQQKMSSFLPVIITAIGAVGNPPNDSGRVINIPYFCKVVRNNELCEYRIIQKTVRCQLAFISPSSADTNSLADQFCTYMMDDAKRRFNVDFVVRQKNEAKGMSEIVESVRASIFDNDSLAPSEIPVTEQNLSVFTVDVEITLPLPQFRFNERNNIDHGVTSTGMPAYAEAQQPVIIKEVDAQYFVENPKTKAKDLDDRNSAKYHDETNATTIKNDGLNDD